MSVDLRGHIQRALAPARRRIAAMVRRTVVRLVDDAPGHQGLQVTALDKEVLATVQRVQEYGFTSHPLPGAVAVVLGLAGNSAHSLAVVVGDRRHRPVELPAGDVALHTELDDPSAAAEAAVHRIQLTRVGDEPAVVVRSGPNKVDLLPDRIEVEAPKVVVKSDDVHLGEEGGPPVARLGDLVHVQQGSSSGFWPIVEGSSKVRAAGPKTGGS